MRIVVPTGLQVQGTNNTPLSYCEISDLIIPATQTTSTGTCNYVVDNGTGKAQITLTLPAMTGINVFYVKLGPIKNPSTTNSVGSFELHLENGAPTLATTSNLIINYKTNDIYDASLATENLRAGSENLYTFKFKITNSIPQNGKISLKFPSAAMYNSFDSGADTTTIDLFGTPAVTFNVVLEPINNQITFTGIFSNGPLEPNSSSFITITISKLKNPTSQTTSASFNIITTNEDGNPIDGVYTGLTVTPD